MLGYSTSYFLGKEWRDTPLYAQKIIPLLDYLLSNNFVYNDKLSGAFYELINKYQNTAELPVNSIKELVKEMGYEYILNILADDDEIVKLLVYLLVLIHQLKGSRQGLELVMSLFSYSENYKSRAITEWFKDIPSNSDRSDVLYWFKKIPADLEDIQAWVGNIDPNEQNLAIAEWILDIPIGGTNDEIYTWYTQLPVTVDYFVSWVSNLTFDTDIKITEWFETTNLDEEVGIENTFSLDTNIDVSKVNAEFFLNFKKFITNYVYPELAKLRVSTSLKDEITCIAYTRIYEKFSAFGRVTGFDGTEGGNVSKKYSVYSPMLVSVDGTCMWNIDNPFKDKYVVTNVILTNTGEQQICRILQSETTIKIEIDSDISIQENTFTAIIMA